MNRTHPNRARMLPAQLPGWRVVTGLVLVAALTLALPVGARSCDCEQPELPRCPAVAATGAPALAMLPDLQADRQVQTIHQYHLINRALERTALAGALGGSGRSSTGGGSALASVGGQGGGTGRLAGESGATLRAADVDRLLPKPRAQVRFSDFADPEFQVAVSRAVDRMGGLRKLLKEAGVLMVNPASPPPSDGRPPDGISDRPIVIDDRCWREARSEDWLPGSAGHLPIRAGTHFPEVGRLLRRTLVAGQPRVDICAMVALSPDWVVTALHCVLEPPARRRIWTDLSGAQNHGIRAFMAPDGAEPQSLNACFDDARLGTPACPLARLTIQRIIALSSPVSFPRLDGRELSVPNHDLALLSVKGMPPDIVFPGLVRGSTTRGTSTIVGFGTTTSAHFSVGFEMQVGWSDMGRLSTNSWDKTTEYAWEGKRLDARSSPCVGDSGGAVFEGFESGFCRCDAARRPVPHSRRLLGLISYVSAPTQPGEPVSIEACKAATKAAAVVPAQHRQWLCAHAPELSLCRNP